MKTNTTGTQAEVQSTLGTPEECLTAEGTPYRLYRDVAYPAAEGEQRMDVYLPSGQTDKPRPAVLIIHGGGWALLDKADPREVEFATFMVDEGYAAVSINYTLTQFEGEPFNSRKLKGAWPHNIIDCKRALHWMKTKADTLGIDPTRIAVMGGSAGGHLALLTGLSSERTEISKGDAHAGRDNSVRCILDFYGIPDVRQWGGEDFLDESEESNPSLWALASPVEHLTKNSPPIFMVHGTADPIVKIELSDEFIPILKEKGIPYEYVVVKDGVHSFALQPPQRDLRPVVRKFLIEHFA
jgi:acetyl esterase/lipase